VTDESALATGAMAALAVLPTRGSRVRNHQVDLKLVIATDVSRSTSSEEARIQREEPPRRSSIPMSSSRFKTVRLAALPSR
jgi:hypothetical protein